MKKTFVAVAVLMILFVGVHEADAQLRYGRPMFQTGILVASATPDTTGTASTGWGIGAAFEQTTWSLSWTFSVSFAYASFSEDLEDGTHLSFSTFPVSLGLRYYFLSGELHPFLGAAVGIHISKQTYTESGGTREISDSGLGVSVPLGLLWEARENIALTVSYIANYTDATFFESNLVHVGQIGLVFR
jgi:hypothetical protein